jgi:hypothetical protein
MLVLFFVFLLCYSAKHGSKDNHSDKNFVCDCFSNDVPPLVGCKGKDFFVIKRKKEKQRSCEQKKAITA